MHYEWMIGVVLASVACLAWICRAASRRFGRPQRRRVMTRALRRGPGAFNAHAWPDVPGAAPVHGFHRPADIELTDPRILPPPREIRGKYGE